MRGAGGGRGRFNLARGSLDSHISQFPVGTYEKAHAHGPGAHVIILSGEGYSLLWHDLNEDPICQEWEVGTLLVPPNAVYHQHFNTGTGPARYLAFRTAGPPRNSQGAPLCFISRRIADQLDNADETPQVRSMFAEALARHGLTSRMEPCYEKERETLPPCT